MFNNSKAFRRTIGAGLILTAIGWLLAGVRGHLMTGVEVIAAGLALTVLPVWLRWRGRGGGNATMAKWHRRTRSGRGTATRWDILRNSSTWTMRGKVAVLRPSLRGESWWRRLRTPVLTYATPLCRASGLTVWTSCEESTLRVGIPGTGKTAELANRVIDAPGGVVVTSTATDLYELTAPLRRARGPVQVFNPSGIGGVTSTLRWSPLTGCADPAVAARRATDLIGPGSGSAEGERWEVQARRVLAVFLHAAALGGYRMRDVAFWVANPEAGGAQILAALNDSPQAVEMSRAAQQTITMNARTRDGVMLAIAPALAWVTQPAAADVGDPQPQDMLFTIAELTDFNAALYLLGDDDGTTGPLVGALVAEIAYQARATAANRTGGRLDPALTMALDEIALVCPTPVDRWMAELRKRNIAIHAACQGLAQLRDRWGDNGASMILNSAQAVLVFGGCKDANDLEQIGKLAGERDEVTETRDADGQVTSTSTRRVPVIEAAMLANLANFRALLIRRGMPVTLCKTPIAWKRRDVRQAQRAEAKTARSTRKAARIRTPKAQPVTTSADTGPASA